MPHLDPLTVLHFVSPFIVLPPLFSLLTSPTKLHDELPGIRPIITQRITPRTTLILFLLSAITLTYALDGVVFIAQAMIRGLWGDVQGAGWTVYALGNVIVWAAAVILMVVKSAYLRKGVVVAGTFALVVETVVLVFAAIDASHYRNPSVYSILHLVLTSLRILHFPILLWALSSPRISFEPVTANVPSATETDALLPGGSNGVASGSSSAVNGTSNGYGATGNGAAMGGKKGGKKGKDGEADGKGIPTGTPPPPTDISWSEYFSRFARLAPFLWPSKSGKLQLLAVSCLVILVAGRAVNVMVPQTLGKVVASLGTWSGGMTPKSPWPPIALYIALRFCQGNGGIFSVMNSLFWAPIMQYSDREMSTMCFNHLLDLSLAFHTKRKTGEVLRILDRGSAINNLFQTLLMNVLPVLFDIAIATIYFYVVYGWLLAGVIGVVMVSYISASISMTTWRTKLRRQMNDRDVITRGIHTDVLMNWESVKYFASEQRESTRYRSAVGEYQAVELKVIASFNLLNFVQAAIITIGMLAGSMIVAYRVTKGQAGAPEFVVFLTYLGQLYGPLNMLGMIYRQLNSGMVDAEKLLKLLEEEKEIVDKPDAKDLVLTDGIIEFKNVVFSYDGKVNAVDGISFTIGKGESVALCGQSGSGKSSLLRLLYRFYDVTKGEILIDGQNIKDVTQKSLRRAIGIVPQDCSLWNDTIEFNIGYGREGATEEEIRHAAEAARLHDRIMTFPEGYKTIVGERGIRLSGGEKQRVSLARTILKAPSILVLDEATSALDTENERFVQQSLNALAEGRSSLMIAHRLSTTSSVTKVVVMRDGKIIEQGFHKDLLAKADGIFASMWQQQMQVEAEEAAKLDATSPTTETKPAPGDEGDVITDKAFADAEKSITEEGTAESSAPSTAVEPSQPSTPKVYRNQGSSPVRNVADAAVDPFVVDIEKGADSPNGNPAGEEIHRATINEDMPESLESVHAPPMISVKDEETSEDRLPTITQEPETAEPDEAEVSPAQINIPDTPALSRAPSTRSNRSTRSGRSQSDGNQLAFPSPRPKMSHSISEASGLSTKSNHLEIIASSSTNTSASTSPRHSMSRSNSADIADLSESSRDKRKRKLSNLGGLVRRVSEQGKAKLKNVGSGSGSATGTGSPVPQVSSPLSEVPRELGGEEVEGKEGKNRENREKRFTLKTRKSDR